MARRDVRKRETKKPKKSVEKKEIMPGLEFASADVGLVPKRRKSKDGNL